MKLKKVCEKMLMNQKGVSLIEILLAVALIGLVVITYTNISFHSMNVNVSSNHLTQAMIIAEKQMNLLRNEVIVTKTGDDLTSYNPDIPSDTINGVEYHTFAQLSPINAEKTRNPVSNYVNGVLANDNHLTILQSEVLLKSTVNSSTYEPFVLTVIISWRV